MPNYDKGFKVLHVITRCKPFGGAQRNTWLNVLHSTERFKSSIACGYGDALPELCKKHDIPFHYIKGLKNEIDPVADTFSLFQLLKLMKREKYEVVHLHSTKAGILGRIAARMTNTPVIIFTIHGVSFDFEVRPHLAPALVKIERWLAGFTDGIISVAQSCKNAFIKHNICPADKVRIIYSAIEYDPIDRATGKNKRQELGFSDDDFIIGAVGHFIKAKGYTYLIEAAPMIKKEIPNAKFIIIGEDGPAKSEVVELIAEKKLEDTIHLAGKRDDVPELLKIMDVYVRSSVLEGLGRALVEAMYAGLPIVATDIWGTREVIDDEETGFIVPSKDPGALADGIINVHNNPEKAKEVGKKAREKVGKAFSTATMVREIEKYYTELLELKAGRYPD